MSTALDPDLLALRYQRLQRANERLERIVEDRTRDLYHANQALTEARSVAEAQAEVARAIVAHAPTPLGVLDAELRLRTANDAFFRLVPEAAIGTDLRTLLPELPALLARLEDRTIRGPETVLARPARWVVPCLSRLPTHDGQVVLLLGIEDHTDLANALRAEELAVEASRTKSAFLANVSHELRTPLNAILGYSELSVEVLEDGGGDVATSVLPDLRRIERAGRTLLALVDDVLDLSKIEAGRLLLVSGTVDLSKLLAEVESEVRPLALRNQNRVVRSSADDVPLLQTDGRRLHQILLNLMSNALKFTQQGEVRLDARRDARSGHVAITVTDTGIGMSPEQLSRLFHPFVQADAAIQHRFGGTGLGLAISRRLAQLLGGDLEVESAPGRGTSATLHVPTQSPA